GGCYREGASANAGRAEYFAGRNRTRPEPFIPKARRGTDYLLKAMAIPESQLETWSHQGSVTQSADTYATIKRALESASAKYCDRKFEFFLQGSYGNDSNIFAESDVDVVIRYDGAFYHDLSSLPPDQHSAF